MESLSNDPLRRLLLQLHTFHLQGPARSPVSESGAPYQACLRSSRGLKVKADTMVHSVSLHLASSITESGKAYTYWKTNLASHRDH